MPSRSSRSCAITATYALGVALLLGGCGGNNETATTTTIAATTTSVAATTTTTTTLAPAVFPRESLVAIDRCDDAVSEVIMSLFRRGIDEAQDLCAEAERQVQADFPGGAGTEDQRRLVLAVGDVVDALDDVAADVAVAGGMPNSPTMEALADASGELFAATIANR
jgi:hypothetical protein